MILDTNDITKITTTNAIHVDRKNISNKINIYTPLTQFFGF